MGWLGSLFVRRRPTVQARRTVVAEVEWERSEELRPDRLGPGADDIRESDESTEVPADPWRPRRSLGPMNPL